MVRQALNELDQWEVQTFFTLTDHVDSQKNPIKLIKDYKEILNKVRCFLVKTTFIKNFFFLQIGDQQSLLQSVKNSADYESFSERAALWENKLNDLEQNLTTLAQIQRKYLIIIN